MSSTTGNKKPSIAADYFFAYSIAGINLLPQQTEPQSSLLKSLPNRPAKAVVQEESTELSERTRSFFAANNLCFSAYSSHLILLGGITPQIERS